MDLISNLCTPVLEDVLACLTAVDVYRLGAACKTLRGRVAAVLGRAPDALKGHVAHIQSFPAHYWGSIAGQLNRQPNATVRLTKLPVLADAFTSAADHEAQSQEQPQQAQQQGQEQANAGGDLAQTAAGFLHRDAQRPLYQLAAAAVLVSTWWGAAPAVEVGDGGRQLAVESVRDCLGDSVADFVADTTRPDASRWPKAACGFWGCIFLGIMASTAAPATSSGIERLTSRLLQLQLGNRGCYAPADQLRELFAARPIAAEVAAKNETEAESQGRPSAAPPASDNRSLCCLRHHVREFLSVVLVLLRCEPLTSGQLLDREALKGLHDAILSAMLRHDGQACAAASQWANSCEQTIQLQAGSNRPAQRVRVGGCEHVDFAKYGLPHWNMMTAEQRSLISGAVRRDRNGKTIDELVIVNSAAGASKTTTAKAIIIWQQLASMNNPSRSCKILYTSYGKDNVDAVGKCFVDLYKQRFQDASLNMPGVTVKTTHKLAARKMKELEGFKYNLRSSFCMRTMMENLRQIPYYRTRLAQGQPGPGPQHAADVIDVLEKFCTSEDKYVTQKLVGEVAGDGQNNFPRIKQNPPDYVAIAQQFMDMIGTGQLRGKVFFTHNLYLKLFVEEVCESGEQLRDHTTGRPFDTITVDEAQDMNPVTRKLVMSQPGTKLLVGDRDQHIMSFNHAEDALHVAPELAKQQGVPVRYFNLTISFRLPRPIDYVAFKAQYKLGERCRAIVAGNTAAGAVYTLHQPAHTSTGTTTPIMAPTCFQQVQLDDVPLPDDTTLPRQLSMVKLTLPPKRPGQQVTTVHLAQLPVDPNNGKRPPLLYLSRFNSTWFEVLAALHVAKQEGKLEQMPKVYLCAQAAQAERKNPTTGGQGSVSSSSQTGDGSDAVKEEEAPTVFLARLRELCELRRQGTFNRNGIRRPSLTGFYSWHKLLEHERASLLNSEIQSALDLFRRYEGQMEDIIRTITESKAANKAEAEYIFSTAHKYKGGEEDYVQIAEDFIHMADGIKVIVVIDEYNLVYVAVTRARRALIMNADVSSVVLEEAVKPLLLKMDDQVEHAAPAAAADTQQEQQQEQQQAKCGRCHKDINNEPEATSPSRLQVVFANSKQQLCAECVQRHTIWGGLLCDEVGKCQYAEDVLVKARKAAQAAARRAAAERAAADKAAAAEAEREELELQEIITQLEADGM